MKTIYSETVTLRFASNRKNETAPTQVVSRVVDALAEYDDRSGVYPWAIIDADLHGNPGKVQDIDNALALAEASGIEVAVTNPCFEYWILLHLEEIDGGFGACGDVLDKLRQVWDREFGVRYEKRATEVCRIVSKNLIDNAATSAERIHRRKGCRRCHACNPSASELYRLVAKLKELGRP